jgi:uncharacterized membrane protein
MGGKGASPHDGGRAELGRLELFSDAVFAIAITLLVLELKVPEPAAVQATGGLAAALFGELPKFAAFYISFAVIGFYWSAHYRMFRHIRRCDGTLLALNLLLLLFVAFLPFPVALLGSFRHEPTAIAFYAVSMALTGLSLNVLWWYATRRRRLVVPDLDRAVVRYIQFRAAAPPVAFAISMPLAFAHASWAMYSWLLVVPLLRIVGRRLAREAKEAEQRSGAGGHPAVPAVVPARASVPSPGEPSPRVVEPGSLPPPDPAPALRLGLPADPDRVRIEPGGTSRPAPSNSASALPARRRTAGRCAAGPNARLPARPAGSSRAPDRVRASPALPDTRRIRPAAW